jgi:hypothetical protein
MKDIIIVLGGLLGLMTTQIQAEETNKPPVRLAIMGLVHTHVRGFLPQALVDPEMSVVGIVEPDQKLVAQIARLYKINTNLFYNSLEELVARTNQRRRLHCAIIQFPPDISGARPETPGRIAWSERGYPG